MKSQLKKNLLFLVIPLFWNLFCTIEIFAQERPIQGRVIDEQGLALPGVTILVKGSDTGTITDDEGSFSFSNLSKDDILIFSFVGMQTEEILVSDQTFLNITMLEEAFSLDEIVAIGYGTMRKSDLTGSVSSINPEKLHREGANSINQLLQDAATGIQVVQNSSEPGGGVSVQIRGSSSINAGTDPLYVIDGMPISNTNPATGGGALYDNQRTARNPLSTLNPNDVESIEILKDASATAIYGARGANGVILITTKSGSSGKLRINYNASVGTQNVAKKLNLLTAHDYMESLNMIQAAGGADELEIVDGITNGGTDWQKEIYAKNALIQNHNLSFSGGNDKTNFFTSFGYFNQNGVVKNSEYERFTMRANLNHNASEKLDIGLNLTASYTFDDFISGGFGNNENSGVLYAAFNWDPTAPIKNDDGSYYRSDFVNPDNPLALLYGEHAISKKYRTFGTFYSEYSIIPDLKIRINIGGDMNFQKRDIYVDTRTRDGYTANGSATILTGIHTNYLIEGLLAYNKKIKKHSVNALAGITTQKFIHESTTAGAEGFVSDLLNTHNLGGGNPELRRVGSSKSDNKILSYLSRINYSWSEKHLFTASFRIDGSSRFGRNNKFGYFPSFAYAWRVNEETFLEDFEELSMLKARISWGQTGNESIGNYQSQSTFGNGPTAVFDDNLTTSQQPTRFANPDLKWETTTQFDIGLDFGFFNNRISGGVDFYQKTTTDMLLNLPVPTTTGFNTRRTNIGSLQNTGLEFHIMTRNFIKTFEWNTSLYLTTLKNKVLDLGGIPQIIAGSAGWANQISIIKEGHPVNSFYGYEIIGVWQEGDDFSTTTDNVSPGDLKYKDQNGDQTVTAEDRVILGNSFPKVTFSLQNNFSYKRFDLDISIIGDYGAKMYNNNLAETYFPVSHRRNRYAEPILNRWTPDNPSSKYPSFVNPLRQGTKYVNSYTVEDASYLRLNNVRLSYSINTNKTCFDSARLFISGENLFTLTNYSGLDPAVNPNGSTDFRIDFNAYPSATTFMLGLDLNF